MRELVKGERRESLNKANSDAHLPSAWRIVAPRQHKRPLRDTPVKDWRELWALVVPMALVLARGAGKGVGDQIHS